jgi:hypothetical protein
VVSVEEAESAHSAERNKALFSINEAFPTITMSEKKFMHYLVAEDSADFSVKFHCPLTIS